MMPFSGLRDMSMWTVLIRDYDEFSVGPTRFDIDVQVPEMWIQRWKMQILLGKSSAEGRLLWLPHPTPPSSHRPPTHPRHSPHSAPSTCVIPLSTVTFTVASPSLISTCHSFAPPLNVVFSTKPCGIPLIASRCFLFVQKIISVSLARISVLENIYLSTSSCHSAPKRIDEQ